MEQLSLWRKLYLGWMVIVARFGHVQTMVILALFYSFLIGPVALIMALFRTDGLGKRDLYGEGTAWQSADSAEPSLDRAKLQT